MLLQFAYCRWLAAVSVVLLLSGGCVGTQTPATRFYLLTPTAADTAASSTTGGSDGPSVEIVAVRLPRYLERPQIVTRSGENRLELAEFDQWGGNLRKNLTRVIAQNISDLVGSRNVVITPYGPPGMSDFRIEIEILQFERDADGRVRLAANWRLSRGDSRVPLAIRTSRLVSPGDRAAGSVEKTVSAMSSLAGELCQEIGREILRLSANPETGP